MPLCMERGLALCVCILYHGVPLVLYRKTEHYRGKIKVNELQLTWVCIVNVVVLNVHT